MAKPTLSPIHYLESKYIPEPNSGCWLWLGLPSRKGYGEYRLGGQPSMQAHRASWIIHHGPVPAGLLVCHKCDVPSCVNPDHLFLGTPQDNSSDMVRKGRSPRGEAAGSARLTTKDVLAIRSSAEPKAALAARYAVHPQTIARIKARARWKHLP